MDDGAWIWRGDHRRATDGGGHVADLAAAYALGALDPAERAWVERHRRVCPACDRLLAGEERVVSLLLFRARAAPPPSPDVKAALLARVAHAHRAGAAGAPAGANRVRRPRPAVAVAPSSGWLTRWSAALLAAPLLVALAVLGTLAVQFRAQAEEHGQRADRFGSALDQTLADVGAVYRLYPGPAAPEARGSVVVGAGRRGGALYVKADEARAGERYRLLGSADGESVDLATVELDGRGRGIAVIASDRPLSIYRTFVVKPVAPGPGRSEPALRGVGAAPTVVRPERQFPHAPGGDSAVRRPTRIGDVGDAMAASVE